MYRSNWSLDIPPGQPPGHLNFWRLACSISLPSGQKSCSNAPPIVTEIPLLKDKFRLQSNTVHAFQREIRRNDTFKLHLKTVLSAFFTNKGEILSWKSFKPCKNRKNSRAYYAPFKGNVQIPPPRARCTVKCPGFARGGCWSFNLTGTSFHTEPLV